MVAVVVTQRADADLDAVFAGLAAQDYPSLRTIIVDLSGTETVAAHAGDVVSGAFVRRLPRDTGPLAAANEVLRLVEGAAFYLFLDPSTVLETSVVRALIEEAYRSNAGILGPKLLDPNDPTRLADVGAAIDKFAGRGAARRTGRARPGTARRGPRRLLGPRRRARGPGRPVRSARRVRHDAVTRRGFARSCAGAPTWPRHASSSCRPLAPTCASPWNPATSLRRSGCAS